MYSRYDVVDGIDGPHLYEGDLNPNPSTFSIPRDLSEAKKVDDEQESKFVNVMLSLTIDEAALLLDAVKSEHRRAEVKTREAELNPLLKELASAADKAAEHQARLCGDDQALTPA
jgi:hypothetical protein